MDKYEEMKKLMRCFPNSFINYQGEFIAHSFANIYFRFDVCETEEDVKFKILSWFSRAEFKSEPYRTKKKNDEFHEFMLKGINEYLQTEFSEEDMEDIYTYFGNECNAKQCRDFIRHGYNMYILRALKARERE